MVKLIDATAKTLDDDLIPYDSKVVDYYISEYYGAAEPPVRCGESHLSGLT